MDYSLTPIGFEMTVFMDRKWTRRNAKHSYEKEPHSGVTQVFLAMTRHCWQRMEFGFIVVSHIIT
jgi:hypothetical protein